MYKIALARVRALDAGEFKESDHPRDKGGKFTSGGGGGGGGESSAAPEHPSDLGYANKGKFGAIVSYEKGGNVANYNTETGKWAVNHEGKNFYGAGMPELTDKLASLENIQYLKEASSGGAAPSPQPVQDYIVNSHVGKIIKAAGFKKVKSPDGVLKFQNADGALIVVHPPKGDKKSSSKWTLKAGEKETPGEGIALAKLVGQVVEKAAKAEPTLAKAEPISNKTYEMMKMSSVPPATELLNSKGYKIENVTPSTIVFKGGQKNGTVEYDPASGEWLAITPGHMTKKGLGLEDLKNLLDGKPFKAKNATSETSLYVDPKIKEAQEAAKAQQAAAAKAAAEKAEAEAKAKQAEYQKYHATLKMLNEAAPKPDGNEAAAIANYTDGGYSSLNTKLRHEDDPKVTPTMKALDSYLARAVVPEDCTVWRKVSGEYAKILKSILITGGKFVDRGYISTSTHEGVWSGSLQFKIDLKKGQRAGAVQKNSSHSGENEVVLPRGTAFVVKSYDPKLGRVHVEIDQTHLGF